MITSDNQQKILPTFPIFTALLLIIFVVLGLNGGFPAPEYRGAFILGVISLILVTLLSGTAAWHLLMRPLPAGHKVADQPILNAIQRQALAVVLGIVTVFIAVGGIWDEIWHRIYGTPFGEDFFWRPHQLLYAGFGITILSAVAGWFVILTRGRGSLQQRFRADPIVGSVTLMGTFLIYALPIDPLWHTIYGVDISAWSIPHIVLAIAFVVIAIMAVITQVSLLPMREWKSLLHAEMRDVLLIFIASFALTALLLLLTSEWDDLRAPLESIRYAQVLERPDWMLASFLSFCSVLVAVLTNHATRRWGAGTGAVLIALLVRLSFISYFDADHITARMWLLSVPSAIAVDIVYAVMITRHQSLRWWVIALVVTLGTAMTVYPLMNQLLVLPQSSLDNLPIWLVTTWIAAAMATWMGQVIGDYATSANKLTTTQAEIVRVRLLAPAALVLTILFIAWFLVSAPPPLL